jgi:hypothetical protein
VTPSSQDSPDKLEADVIRARRAEQIQAEPVLQEAWGLIEADIIAKLKTAPVRDKAGRDELVTLLQLNERYRKALDTVITTGKLAEQKLGWLQRMKRRAA